MTVNLEIQGLVTPDFELLQFVLPFEFRNRFNGVSLLSRKNHKA
jgi:hypothetical protein